MKVVSSINGLVLNGRLSSQKSALKISSECQSNPSLRTGIGIKLEHLKNIILTDFPTGNPLSLVGEVQLIPQNIVDGFLKIETSNLLLKMPYTLRTMN